MIPETVESEERGNFSRKDFENAEPKKSENLFENTKKSDTPESLTDRENKEDLSEFENKFDFSRFAAFVDTFFKYLETTNSSENSGVEQISDDLSEKFESEEIEDEDEQTPKLRRTR